LLIERGCLMNVPTLLAVATVWGIEHYWRGEIADIIHEHVGRVGGFIVTLVTLQGAILLLERCFRPSGPLDPNNSGPLSEDEPDD
jgi:hypothetical protein